MVATNTLPPAPVGQPAPEPMLMTRSALEMALANVVWTAEPLYSNAVTSCLLAEQADVHDRLEPRLPVPAPRPDPTVGDGDRSDPDTSGVRALLVDDELAARRETLEALDLGERAEGALVPAEVLHLRVQDDRQDDLDDPWRLRQRRERPGPHDRPLRRVVVVPGEHERQRRGEAGVAARVEHHAGAAGGRAATDERRGTVVEGERSADAAEGVLVADLHRGEHLVRQDAEADLAGLEAALLHQLVGLAVEADPSHGEVPAVPGAAGTAEGRDTGDLPGRVRGQVLGPGGHEGGVADAARQVQPAETGGADPHVRPGEPAEAVAQVDVVDAAVDVDALADEKLGAAGGRDPDTPVGAAHPEVAGRVGGNTADRIAPRQTTRVGRWQQGAGLVIDGGGVDLGDVARVDRGEDRLWGAGDRHPLGVRARVGHEHRTADHRPIRGQFVEHVARGGHAPAVDVLDEVGGLGAERGGAVAADVHDEDAVGGAAGDVDPVAVGGDVRDRLGAVDVDGD